MFDFPLFMAVPSANYYLLTNDIQQTFYVSSSCVIFKKCFGPYGNTEMIYRIILCYLFRSSWNILQQIIIYQQRLYGTHYI